MKRLTPPEINACRFLAKHGPYTPGDAAKSKGGPEVVAVLRSLVRKGRVSAEQTDDGYRYSLTAQGEFDAA